MPLITFRFSCMQQAWIPAQRNKHNTTIFNGDRKLIASKFYIQYAYLAFQFQIPNTSGPRSSSQG